MMERTVKRITRGITCIHPIHSTSLFDKRVSSYLMNKEKKKKNKKKNGMANDADLFQDHERIKKAYPRGHFVHFRSPVMVIEYDDRQHDRRCHHEHDAVEIRSCAFQTIDLVDHKTL